MPKDFIALAEETGFILRIGQWALKTACAQIKAWENHPHAGRLQISVNVSPRQFRQNDFVAQVDQAIHFSAINPNRLKL